MPTLYRDDNTFTSLNSMPKEDLLSFVYEDTDQVTVEKICDNPKKVIIYCKDAKSKGYTLNRTATMIYNDIKKSALPIYGNAIITEAKYIL